MLVQEAVVGVPKAWGTNSPEANVKAEGSTKKLKVQSLMKKKRKRQDETAVPAVLAQERHNWQMEEGTGFYQKCIPWWSHNLPSKRQSQR